MELKTEITPFLSWFQRWQLERYGNYLPEIENETAAETNASLKEESYIYLLENPPKDYE